MLYDVTFQINGDEQTMRVEAPDAATAASRARNAHAGDDTVFELLLVHLVEDDEDLESAPEATLPAKS